MLDEMKRELVFHSELNFLYRAAGRDSKKQVEQIHELLQSDIDLLIISPNEAQPLTAVVEEVFSKGIPVVVVDSKINSSLYTAFVGADNYEIGKMAGLYAAHLLNGKGDITEIYGLPASSPAIERHKGFSDAIKDKAAIRISDSIWGNWEKQKAQSEIEKKGNSLQTDLVFAHNDVMALGAYEALRKSRPGNKIKILGIDGLPGENGGMQFVTDKILTATMVYPTGGQEAIRIASRILNKEDYKKDNYLQSSIVDSSNVRLLNLQTNKVLDQQREIERQQNRLFEQERIYNNQKTFVYILVSSLILSLALGGVSFYSLRENKKINRKLKNQNVEILRQKDQLAEMSVAAEAANEAKVNFFTKLSHEFRTPLTLILGPLEDLKSWATNQAALTSVSTVQKNAVRLLRLVNQLMDFRRIEVDKMKIQATENDVIETVSEIMQSFKALAQKRNIDFRLITKERKLHVWFDVSMIDKVIFNLLSNAFKFTNDNGYVNVYISKSADGANALITFEDNGIGMTKEAQEHAFDMFYQEEYETDKGSGLGLALSYELIQMHQGEIRIDSEKWKGTRFHITLPLGNKHLVPGEIMDKPSHFVRHEFEKLFAAELEPAEKTNAEEFFQTETKSTKEFSILLIEDNADLRKFLAEKLETEYEVLQADNGKIAVQNGFDYVPDLIICDIVIPGKDGISITKIFKHDIRTSHIPIILLTAKTEIDKQVEGMKNMADAYITKPFSMQFLKETIKSLLSNRSLLKEHFTSDISSSLKTQVVNKIDRKFINEFTSFVEGNLANEELSVEDVSKGLGIPKIQLHRKIKALLDVNVSDYILNTRLTKAKYLLKNEDLNINEIAFKVGFSSASYFSTVFKSKTGISPKDYKRT